MAGTVNLTGNLATAYGTFPLNIPLNIPTPLGSVTLVTLASGFNSIAIPTGTTLIIVILPTGNTATVTLKGITGDAGILLNKVGIGLLQPDPADTTFGLTSGALQTAATTIIFL